MKILCLIDFTSASLNAIEYILDYTKRRNDIKIELLHCIENVLNVSYSNSRATTEKDKADNFLELYKTKLTKLYSHAQYSSKVEYGYTNTFIADRADQLKADLIVLGSKGLSRMKDLTQGSVTENVVKHTYIPVLCIPLNSKFTKMERVAIAVDNKEIKHPLILNFLLDYLLGHSPKLSIIQVKPELHKAEMEYDERIDDYLENWEVEVRSLYFDHSIPNTINEYISSKGVDMTCYIHRKRNWLSKMFQYTNLKDELYELEYPMLIFSD